jgi:hypothetical protein
LDNGDGAKWNKSIVLGTDSFSLREIIILMNVLKIRYDINCTLQGLSENKPRIYVLQESFPKLVSIVKPFLIQSMLYKLHL